MKNKNSTFTKEKIQLVNELHKPISKNFRRRRTIIKGLDDLWQADLGQLDLYAKFNKNYKYILTVIDCFSKFLWMKPLKTKSGEEVATAFESILQNRKPHNLQTDQGKEFFNTNFKELMVKYNINHYNTYSCKKASIAERVLRTIKERLFKYFSLSGSYRWIDVLPSIVYDYNHTKHKTINKKPIFVNKNNENEVLKYAYNHIKLTSPIRKFSVGDIVRISKAKHIFEKGYMPNWTTELFKVSKVKITNPVTYLLEDLEGSPIKGAFYEAELQQTKQPDLYLVEKVLRKRGNKVYVKWLGFDNRHNSWINKTNRF